MSVLAWLLGGVEPAPGGRLAWGAGPGELLLLGGLLALALLLALWTARGHRWAQGLALLPGLLALLLAAARPSWELSGTRREPGRFVLLVDDSLSMGVGERAGEARRIAEELAGRGPVERYRFGSGLEEGPPSFEAEDTDLGAALAELSRRFAGERLRGIALVTDGADRGALRQQYREEGRVDPPELPGPLTVYAVGDGEGLVDLAVRDLHSGGFAFVRAPFTLSAEIRGIGLAGRSFPVTLLRDGALEARRTVTLDEEGRAEVSFQVTPERVGRFAWELRLPRLEGDAVPANDSAAVVVRVVRDRMRVLQVCGAPSADQKFLRLLLKQDPAVDLVSFFIMRTEEDLGAGYADEELSLIPFPYEQLFTRDLWTFDLVIFQNFDYAPYFGWSGDALLSNLVDYVRKGGAFAMIGGDRSFDLGGYASTPLAELLPVRLGVQREPPVNLERFSPRLTGAGLHHPVTALSADPDENRATWARLSPLDGLNLSLGPAGGAAVLLEHPRLRDPQGEPLPVLAVRQFGQGRSLALMVDSSWRWSFAEAGRGRGNQAYLRFWKQALRWLVADPESRRLVVEPVSEQVPLGEPIRLRVRLRDTAFRPRAGVRMRGRLTGPSFEGDEGKFEGRTDEAGELLVSLPSRAAGAHRVRVRAAGEREGEELEASTVVAVTDRRPELEDVLPDPDFLSALASAAGGRFVGPGEHAPPLEDPEAGRELPVASSEPLWAAPWLPLLFALSASLSWWLRRRGGGR